MTELTPIELIWAVYDKDKIAKHYLLIYLGQKDNNIVALLADELTNKEIRILRDNLDEIRKLEFDRISNWLKQHLPVGFKKGYRHFKADKFQIIINYNLKGLEKK